MYQALVGQHPFYRDGMTLNEFEDFVCSSDHHLTEAGFLELPQEFRILIARLLEKERANRPHDASQVAGILRRIGAK